MMNTRDVAVTVWLTTLTRPEDYENSKVILREDYGQSWFSPLLFHAESGEYGLVSAKSAEEGESYLEAMMSEERGWSIVGKGLNWGVVAFELIGMGLFAGLIIQSARRRKRR